MRRVRGFVASLLGLSVGLGFLTACAAWPWSTPSTNLDRTVRLSFPAYGLSFDVPVAWRQATYGDVSTMSASIVYLSTEPMHQPCYRLGGLQGSISCGWPLEHLRPGGVFVSWTSFGMPGTRLLSRPGTPTTIGGRPARVVTSAADAACAQIGGQISVHAAMAQRAMGSHDQLFQMSACLRDPGIEQAEIAVHRMLDSVRITG